MLELNRLALLLLFLTLTAPSAESVVRSLYAEHCNETMKCVGGSWLDCYNGNCVCLNQEEMTYDWKLGKCVSRAGQRCNFAAEETGQGQGYSSFIVEVADCVTNAACSQDGICRCDNHTHNIDGECVPFQGHLHRCDEHHTCSEYHGLQCQNGICECDLKKSIYFTSTVLNLHDTDIVTVNETEHQNKNQCVGLAGFPCINSRCTQHAQCSENNTCICEGNFYAHPVDSLCTPKHTFSQNCTGNHQCGKLAGAQLACIEGKCDCDPHFSKYSAAQTSFKMITMNSNDSSSFVGFEGPIVMQCVGLLHSNCIDRLCVPKAYCSYKNSKHNDFSGTCECQSSFDESQFHSCGIGYGKECTPYSCIEGLVCKNSLCSCPFRGQTYNGTIKSCVSRVGGPCNDYSNVMSHAHADHSGHYHNHLEMSRRNNETIVNSMYSFGCGEGAECRPTHGKHGHGHKNHRGSHCACKQGFVENEFGICRASYGTNCTTVAECDSVSALQCIDGTCQCDRFAEFDEKVRKCVGLVGAHCDVHLKHECTDHAHCHQDETHPRLPGICSCDQGYDENANYTCDHNHQVQWVAMSVQT